MTAITRRSFSFFFAVLGCQSSNGEDETKGDSSPKVGDTDSNPSSDSDDAGSNSPSDPRETETDSSNQIEYIEIDDEKVSDSGAPHGRLRVAGGSLLDGDQNPVALRGLSLGELGSIKALGRWDEDYFENARSWDAELVKLPVSPATFRADPEQTLRDLDDSVAWCQAHELYLIIDYCVIGNISKGVFESDESEATWEDAAVFWASVARRYSNVSTVAFGEIYDSPAALEELGGGWDFRNWRSHANELVAILREFAPEMIPLVGGLDFAYDFSPGGDTPFSDPDIALAVHPRPGKARTDRRLDWDAAFGYLADRYPIVLTDVAFDPYDELYPAMNRDDLSYGREILSYAEENQMSWTASSFAFDPDWAMPLFSEWDELTPTVSGLFFKDVLTGSDIETAGDGFGELPPVEPPASNGPSDLHWSWWGNDDATAEWIEEPTPDRAAVHLESTITGQAGMFATFSWDLALVDLSVFNEIVFEAAVAEGDPFSIVIGRNVGHAEPVFIGCSWDLVGEGDATYTVDMLTASWCGPTETCFDMQSSGIGFNSRFGVESAVDISVKSVEFLENSDNPLSPSCMGR